jgi:hypothetical protein
MTGCSGRMGPTFKLVNGLAGCQSRHMTSDLLRQHRIKGVRHIDQKDEPRMDEPVQIGRRQNV